MPKRTLVAVLRWPGGVLPAGRAAPGLAPVLLLLVLLLLGTGMPAAAQRRFVLAETPGLLSKAVLPSTVDLRLVLDPDQAGFDGQVSMQLRVSQAQAALVLHAAELDAGSARLTSVAAPARRGGPPRRTGVPRPLRVEADDKNGTWRLVPLDGLPVRAGAWQLDIDYRGRVQTAGQGLYRADFRVRGEAARMLGTQLQAVHARNLLPAFDEPLFRSVFRLTVRAPAGYQVLSNMPLLQSAPVPAGVEHRFAPSPPMPSYLLAVAVGRFDVLQDRSGHVPLRIFTAPGKADQAQFAMQVTKQVLPYFAAYFGRGYMLPKLDQIAVPGTRDGAMEDWGLISYIESLLLFDPARSSDDTRREVFRLVAHEIAHQWFGNLVSVASWNEIWLNEAFATWMADKAAEHFHPEWQTALRLRSSLERPMSRDATAATRAIRGGPVSEASVFEVFDGITYGKGGAVLTMLEQWLGEDAFRRGLAAYMAERAFKPATAGDLWFHIGRSAGQPVAQVAASWTDQPGLPLLDLQAVCERGDTLVTLKQSRFSLDTALPGGPWALPVRLARGPEQRTLLLNVPSQQLRLAGCSAQPLLANAGGRGYYIVDYDPDGWSRAAAAFARLAPADRVTLLSDSFVLARAGRRAMADHLALLAALPLVDDASRPALYSLAATHWRTLDVALDATPAQAPLRAAGHALFGPELARLGWMPRPGEDSETQRLRATLIRQLAALNHAPTIAAARERLTAALAGDGSAAAAVPRSIRSAVLHAAGRDVDEAGFQVLLGAMLGTESSEERELLAEALAGGHDPVRAQRLLDEAVAGRLPPDTAIWLPSMVARQPGLAPLAYAFVLQHWPTLSRLAGEGAFGGRYWLLPSAIESSSDVEATRRMVDDQRRLNGEAGDSSARQVLAAVENRHRLRQREAQVLESALAGWAPR